MASKRAIRRRACEGKRRYASRPEAKRAIFNAWRHGTVGLNYYHCEFCGGIHIGHLPGWVKKIREEKA